MIRNTDIFSEDCLDELESKLRTPIRLNCIMKLVDIRKNVVTTYDIFFYTVYEGYEKIIQEQDDELRQPYTADELIDILKEKIVVFEDSVSFEKFTINSISVVMTFTNPKAFEWKYIVIRDLLAKYGWYMIMKQDYVRNGEPTSSKQLVFEPAQERSFINTVMEFVKKVFSTD